VKPPSCATWLLLPLLLTACTHRPETSPPSSLPEYARPHAETLRPEQYAATDVIRYRAVTRSDFRAATPPAQLGGNATRLGAYTCTNIVPHGGPSVTFAPRPDGTMMARLANASFYAEMDRSCSWWNAKSRLEAPYILEHEQIHFALTEIQARRLTARMQGVEVAARDPQAATREIQKIYDRLAQESSQELVRDSTRFDEETSFRISPTVQKRWLHTVERQLTELSP
jgi:hypothetical protein